MDATIDKLKAQKTALEAQIEDIDTQIAELEKQTETDLDADYREMFQVITCKLTPESDELLRRGLEGIHYIRDFRANCYRQIAPLPERKSTAPKKWLPPEILAAVREMGEKIS